MTAQHFILQTCASIAAATFPGAGERRARDVAAYLAHVEGGVPMRAIARATGKEPSTVLRAVRRVEAERDDPLLDQAILELEAGISAAPGNAKTPTESPMNPASLPASTAALSPAAAPGDAAPTRFEATALSRLSEPEAFLMVAKGAEKAGVFCRKNQFRKPLSLLPLKTAKRFLALDWIKCSSKTEMTARYVVTESGRASLRRRESEWDAQGRKGEGGGFAEAPSIFSGQHQVLGERRVANPHTGEIETIRVNLGESPLGWLSKRKDANGAPLLSPEEVEAGERLREDFEMAQIGPRVGQDWRRFLTPSETSSGPGRTPSEGPLFARERVAKAVDALGSGLSDAAIRICCFHEGLETTERRMGWSARSGKVVLKLALQRLVEHYGLNVEDRRAA